MNYDRLNFLHKQLEEQGDDPFLLYGIAMEYINTDTQKALEWLDRTRLSFPDYLPTYYKLASVLDGMDKPERALEILEEGIELAKGGSNEKTLAELEQYARNLRMELY